MPASAAVRVLVALICGLGLATTASAEPDETVEAAVAPMQESAIAPADSALSEQVLRLANDASQSALPGKRVEVRVGRLDPRLKLAPCEAIEPYLPPGARLWGRTRVGVRCVSGPTRWNVYLPVTVHVWGEGVVAAGALRPGSVLTPADLSRGEIDLAAEPGAPVNDGQALVGRILARPLAAGQAVRSAHLKPRLWFQAGTTVRLTAVGNGYAIRGTGQALSPGVEGQSVRVRTESGRVVTGSAIGTMDVEIRL
jgi:flagella basal body P-ring formation protein FlgA